MKKNWTMRTDRILSFAWAIAISGVLLAQRPSPAPAQTKSVLVTGGTVHVGDGKVIDDGAVGFRNGRIDYVGYNYGVTVVYDTVIDVKGRHVYPGIIAPDSPLGLLEVEQIRATSDMQDLGGMEPELRAIPAYKADSRVIPTVRSNGVLMAQIAPQGLTIAGTSSIVQLDAWDGDAAVIRSGDGVFMTWPAAYQRSGWWAEPGETDNEKKDERAKKIEEIRTFIRKAKAYAQAPPPVVKDPRMESMRPLFTGSASLFVRANAAREIIEAVQLAKAEGIKRTVIVGGYDAWRVADLLRENKVDVILRRTHSLPLRPDDDVDLPYRLPALLKERGVRFCLDYAGDHEHAGVRNLPFVAGTARAYGLDSEDALRAITLDAAAVLGIDDRCGSLTIGKDATLFVSAGDALDMRGNDVQLAFIQGRRIVLDDHQKELYRQYKRRAKQGQ
ncbi:MAG: amidohydrolase family protein [Flavobacteriales bacterium]|nr:amidohydrolase family protein [Flavobacteriales bacterium]